MRSICFSDLVTDTQNTYAWIKCIDVRGETYEYKETSNLEETSDGYQFHHVGCKILWPHSILVRVELGPSKCGCSSVGRALA